MTVDDANRFIAAVNRRADGEIPDPILQAFLVFHPGYLDQPQREFLDGFINRFRSTGHVKSRGLQFHVDIPKSWMASEGNRPNVIQTFKSRAGSGQEMIVIEVRDLPSVDRAPLSREQADALAAGMAGRDMVPREATFLSSGSVRIDGIPGVAHQYVLKSRQLDFDLTARTLSYTLVLDRHLLQIQFSVGTEPIIGNRDINERFLKFELLFKLIANSIVIESQWQ